MQREFIIRKSFLRQNSNDKTNLTWTTIRKSQAKLLRVYLTAMHTKANEHTRAQLKIVAFTLHANECCT